MCRRTANNREYEPKVHLSETVKIVKVLKLPQMILHYIILGKWKAPAAPAATKHLDTLESPAKSGVLSRGHWSRSGDCDGSSSAILMHSIFRLYAPKRLATPDLHVNTRLGGGSEQHTENARETGRLFLAAFFSGICLHVASLGEFDMLGYCNYGVK